MDRRSGIDAMITPAAPASPRDVTPEAIEPLFEKRMDGFSVAFHMLSHAKIGTSTIQSRADCGCRGGHVYLLFAGIAGRLPRRLGRHSRSPARLPHAALQFCGDQPRLDEHLRRPKAQGASA